MLLCVLTAAALVGGPASGSRADVEMAVMQNAFADVAHEPLRSGVSD